MTDGIVRGNHDPCLRSLGAAIADSADISGMAGGLLRSTLTNFGAFATQLEEESVGWTQAQLQQTLKSIDNFHIAFKATRDSLERRVRFDPSASNTEKLTARGHSSNSTKEELNASKLTDDQQDTAEKLFPGIGGTVWGSHYSVHSTEWMASAEQNTKSCGRKRVLEEKMRLIGLTQSGVELAQMSPSEFESMLLEKQLNAEHCEAARDIRVKLRKRYQRKRYGQQFLKKTPSCGRVDYEGMLASFGITYTLEEIGKMPLATFKQILVGLKEEQISVVKILRGKAMTKLRYTSLREEKIKKPSEQSTTADQSLESVAPNHSFHDISSTSSAVGTATTQCAIPSVSVSSMGLIPVQPPVYLHTSVYTPAIEPLLFDTAVGIDPIDPSRLDSTKKEEIEDQDHEVVWI